MKIVAFNQRHLVLTILENFEIQVNERKGYQINPFVKYFVFKMKITFTSEQTYTKYSTTSIVVTACEIDLFGLLQSKYLQSKCSNSPYTLFTVHVHISPQPFQYS